MTNVAKTVILTSMAALLVGCSTGPTRIDPTGDQAVVTQGIDYEAFVAWSGQLTDKMLASGFLQDYPRPVRMVVSDVENRTDLPYLPEEGMIGRIRSKLGSSGQVRYVSSIGTDAVDRMNLDVRELDRDPRFERREEQGPGTLVRPRLSLGAQILSYNAVAGRERQDTYEVRMYVTDLDTGEVVWEDFSEPIAKFARRGVLGF
ncbi:MAG: hypothetical protein ACFCVE_05070 [Phycisphaerae bacterium]